MKRLIFASIIALFSYSGYSQICGSLIVSTIPEEPTATDEITLTVKFTCPEYEQWGVEDIYLWVWTDKTDQPSGLPDMFPGADDVQPLNGLGDQAWKNSNPYLKMEKIGDNTYQYVFTPTIMFKLNPSDLRSMGFLCKPKDGGGYGDPDMKTEDQELVFKSLTFIEDLGRTFPATVSANDIITIYFNQKIADDATFAAYTGNLLLTIRPYVDNTPAGPEMVFSATKTMNGNIPEHKVTLLPNEHLDLSNLSEGQKVNKLIYYFHNQLKTLKSEEFTKILIDLK
ncbi:MAG: hypothetical protein PHD06_01235 [Bacteroidales bacterium]|jgi:hypothetical protein|nr:hypothetical protein [Bacteroidales bacterium]MDD4383780.1 hypothetical protein [Bacteroidales bacterium]MDY0198347.1 hypothetical protein [Tenuifilaceae bacterium]